MKNRNMRDIVRMAVTLFVIALVTSAVLGVVNAVTEDRIAELREEAQAEAMREVLPAASGFTEITDRLSADFMEQNSVTGIYQASGTDGYVVTVAPKGFGGEIRMTVGVQDGAITGVVITELSETPGLGARANDAGFLSQYVGKHGAFQLVKGAANENQVSAITGATVTSRAVTAGALAAVKAAGEAE